MERKERHEVIKMQESGVLSNWGGKACGLAGKRENGVIWGFLPKQLKE
jgi:hypothetical protein